MARSRARLDLGQRQRRQTGAGDIEARAAPGADQAFGGQTIIGLDDGGRRDLIVVAKLRIEGSRSPGAERAACHFGADRAPSPSAVRVTTASFGFCLEVCCLRYQYSSAKLYWIVAGSASLDVAMRRLPSREAA